MDKEATYWEHKITEKEGTDKEEVHIFKGRTYSNLDTPAIMRQAGVPINQENAMAKIMMEYPDILVEVLLKRCVLSHSIGYDITDDFRPTDFSNDDREFIMLMIMRPFKVIMVKEALKIGKGHILDVMTDKEIAFAKENSWFTPEEAAAIDADVFLARDSKAKHNDLGKEPEQTAP